MAWVMDDATRLRAPWGLSMDLTHMEFIHSFIPADSRHLWHGFGMNFWWIVHVWCEFWGWIEGMEPTSLVVEGIGAVSVTAEDEGVLVAASAVLHVKVLEGKFQRAVICGQLEPTWAECRKMSPMESMAVIIDWIGGSNGFIWGSHLNWQASEGA